MSTKGEDNPTTKAPRTVTSDLKAIGRWVDRHARYFLAASVIGFVITAVLHISTYLITPTASMWYIGALLFIGALLMVIAHLELAPRLKTRAERWRPLRPRYWQSFLFQIPKRSLRLIKAVAVYAALNLVVSLIVLHEGMPDIVNGKLVIVYKGVVVREIPRETWDSMSEHQFRMLAMFPMYFYAYLAAFFHHRPDVKLYRDFVRRRRARNRMGSRRRSAPKVPGA